MTDRIPCINPSCRRTAPSDKHEGDDEIVCGKCWKLLPRQLKDRYRMLRKRERKLLRLIERKIDRKEIDIQRLERVRYAIWKQMRDNWLEIRTFYLMPENPIGIESFLDEIGLND